MKTLIILAHPDLEKSKVNKRWIEEAEKYLDKFTVHKLYEAYPNEIIDIKNEQELIEKHKGLILQFPIYWFNCPSLLKKWLDEVFTDGWAYGKGGDKLSARNIALTVTAGIDEKNYSKNGKYKYSLKEILIPFEITFDYCSANYKGFYAFYSAEFEATKERIGDSVREYIDFINSI
ncbi:NAD(P)H-dependent oxidoreductase [Pseudoleptotrichia goodfellowii]|uniref:NAD(P)H oxidoreductase n=1 Tax=Pseudoleptotrichia goodfellowii TaxID=157692 RepID=A0A510JAB5_9FUSO|nr:NAD(P)H-dependent oxidoreductase [Pseudoleptotrichia goodfellowii]BBM36278.1 NAD(P)H oxidoreductase [Pseudoleptotrichia goodfellowii]